MIESGMLVSRVLESQFFQSHFHAHLSIASLMMTDVLHLLLLGIFLLLLRCISSFVLYGLRAKARTECKTDHIHWEVMPETKVTVGLLRCVAFDPDAFCMRRGA